MIVCMSGIKHEDISPVEIRLGARYNYIVYPLENNFVLRFMLKLGYTPLRSQFGKPETLRPDEQLVFQKDGITVDFYEPRQIVGLNSNNPEKLTKAFQGLEKNFSSELDEDLSTKIHFYESIMQYSVKSDNNPVKIISNTAASYPYSTEISNIIGSRCAPFNLRYVSTESMESEQWFDLNIEPLLSSMNNRYLVTYVVRNKKFDLVAEKLLDSKSILSRIIETIEKQT